MSRFLAPAIKFGSPAHPMAHFVPAPGPICNVDCAHAVENPAKQKSNMTIDSRLATCIAFLRRVVYLSLFFRSGPRKRNREELDGSRSRKTRAQEVATSVALSCRNLSHQPAL